MEMILKELSSRKEEIQNELELLFQTNMKITDWDVPEADDKQAAKVILDIMQDKIDTIKEEVANGRYDYY